jgi:DNA-binding transcriptional LysR family regulator
MDLHQIEIFCSLIKFRSFSKAAEALYLTQPTVSGHIKNLETELGTRLLDRIGKRVVPTEAGEVLFRSGQKLLALRDQARDEIKGLSGGIAGLLRIGASTIPGAYILPSRIGAFKKKFPDVSIHLDIGDTASVTGAVLRGDLHIGVVGAHPDDSHLETHSYLKDELVIAVHPKHPWAKKKNISVEVLAGEPFVLREKGSGTRQIMEDRLNRAGITFEDLNAVAVAGSSDAVRQSVKAGLGVSILSIRALQDDIKASRLAAVRIKGIPLERNFFIIMLKGKSRSPLCRAFLEYLLKEKIK